MLIITKKFFLKKKVVTCIIRNDTMKELRFTYNAYESGVICVLQGSGWLPTREHKGGNVVVEEAVGVEHYVQEKPATSCACYVMLC